MDAIGVLRQHQVWKWVVWATLALVVPAGLCAESPQEREKRLQGRLVASCCWSEPISIHRSEAAAEMRAQLHAMLAEGRSDEQILEAFTAQYGQRVLIEPEGGLGVATYAMPALAGVIGLCAVFFVLRKWKRTSEAV